MAMREGVGETFAVSVNARFRITLVALATLALAGCGRQRPQASDDKGAVSVQKVSLDWTMTRAADGKSLRLDYTVANRSNERVFVCDILTATDHDKLVRADDRVIVMNGPAKGVVLFSRGVVDEHVPSSFPRNPGGRAVDPGGELRGSANVALPLQAWHNFGYAQPLDGTPKRAVLEVSILDGEAQWLEEHLADGSTIKTPARPARLVNVRGAELEIPRS